MAGEIIDFLLSVAWISHTTSNHVIISLMYQNRVYMLLCLHYNNFNATSSFEIVLFYSAAFLEAKRRVCSNPRVHMTWFEGLWDILATLSQKSLGEICRIAILIQGGGCTFSDVHNSTLPTHNKKNSTK